MAKKGDYLWLTTSIGDIGVSQLLSDPETDNSARFRWYSIHRNEVLNQILYIYPTDRPVTDTELLELKLKGWL